MEGNSSCHDDREGDFNEGLKGRQRAMKANRRTGTFMSYKGPPIGKSFFKFGYFVLLNLAFPHHTLSLQLQISPILQRITHLPFFPPHNFKTFCLINNEERCCTPHFPLFCKLHSIFRHLLFVFLNPCAPVNSHSHRRIPLPFTTQTAHLALLRRKKISHFPAVIVSSFPLNLRLLLPLLW